MIPLLFPFAAIVGIIIAQQQFQNIDRRGVIHWVLFRLLTRTILFALISGIILHQIGKITSMGLYLYLISTGISLGLFMTFERLLKKHWQAIIIITFLAGLCCKLFMNYKTDMVVTGSFIIGCAPGIGYFIWGLIKEQWVNNAHQDV